MTYEPCCDTVVVESAAEQPTPAPAPQEPTPAPAEPDVPEAAPAVPEPPGGGETNSSALPPDAAALTIQVPADARVFINGLATKSTGTERTYVSYGLKPGRTYKYEVRAVVTRGGQAIEDVQVVYLRAGASEGLALNLGRSPQRRVVSLW